MDYHEIMKIFIDYCIKQNCKHKIVGDIAYKNFKNVPTHIIRFVSAKDGVIKVYDSKKAAIIEIYKEGDN